MLSFSDITLLLFNSLTHEQVGLLVMAAKRYDENESVTFDDKILSIVFESVKKDIDTKKRYTESRKINGAKGGRPKSKNSDEKAKKPTKPYGFLGFSDSEKGDLSSLDSSLENQVTNESNTNIEPLVAEEETQEKKEILKKETKAKKSKFVADLDFIENGEHRELMEEWLDYRVKLKQPYKTQVGIKRCYSSLLKLSNGDTGLMRQIIEQSEANEWQGLFELKNNNNGRNSRNTERSQSGFETRIYESSIDA